MNAAELLAQAARYEDFAPRAGHVLEPTYRSLAAELRLRAAALTDPAAAQRNTVAAGEDADPLFARPDEGPRPRLQPPTMIEIGEAWRTFLAMVTARRSGIDRDGGELLGDTDPRHVVWVATLTAGFLLDQVSEETAERLIRGWALSAAMCGEMPNG